MPRPSAPSRRTLLLYLLAIEAYVSMLVFGPWSESTHPERVFMTVLAGGVTLLLVFLSRRIAFGLLAAAWFFMLIATASVLKETYLTTPLLALDLIYFLNRDTVEVISRYPVLLSASLIGLFLLPLALYGVWRIDPPCVLAACRRTWLRRLLLAAGVAVSGTAVALTLRPSGPFSEIYAKGMWLAMIDKSYLTNFFVSFHATQIELPPISSKPDPAITWGDKPATPEPPADPDAAAPAEPPAEPVPSVAAFRPDIVAVLEESTFDPRMLQVCTLPVCKRRLFMPDARTRATGFLQVHTFGGGTWTAEFAFITGIAHEIFGNAGLYAPFNLAPRVVYSLMKSLKTQGYRSIVIYPTAGSFINARNAYDFYGVDRLVDNADTGLGWESPDSKVFEVFERIYADERAAHPDQPLFVFVLTLRQHGPHMTPLKNLPAPYNKPLFAKKIDDWLNLNLGNYLYRLEQSDLAMGQLEKKLLGGKQPVILLHFGDHQPSFDGALNNLVKNVPKGIRDPSKVTYYMLKTNFAPAHRFDLPVLDIIYLGGLLLDVADLPKNPFYVANTQLRERCKGRYLDCTAPGMLDSYHAHLFDELHALKD